MQPSIFSPFGSLGKNEEDSKPKTRQPIAFDYVLVQIRSHLLPDPNELANFSPSFIDITGSLLSPCLCGRFLLLMLLL